MIDMKISLQDVLTALANTMDLLNGELSGHHKRVAYISNVLAEACGLQQDKRKDLYYAAILHDSGALSLAERLEALQFEARDVQKHAYMGYILLKDFKPFSKAAEIVAYHHTYYSSQPDAPFESRILHLADRIDTLIDKRKDILSQVKYIIYTIEKEAGEMFDPLLTEIFSKLAVREAFWLNILHSSQEPVSFEGSSADILDYSGVSEVSRLLERLIDFRSRFTSTHSSGVSAVAEELGHILGLSEEECFYLKIAGNLHDLGKLAVPLELLEKKGNLTEDEYNIIKCHTYFSYKMLERIRGLEKIRDYACFHHEKLDGKGYPFHLNEEELPLGSKIMAVSDIFTALSEDRPYRSGMEAPAVMEILGRMADRREIEGLIVNVLVKNYDRVNCRRINSQLISERKYEEFAEISKAYGTVNYLIHT